MYVGLRNVEIKFKLLKIKLSKNDNKTSIKPDDLSTDDRDEIAI